MGKSAKKKSVIVLAIRHVSSRSFIRENGSFYWPDVQYRGVQLLIFAADLFLELLKIGINEQHGLSMIPLTDGSV